MAQSVLITQRYARAWLGRRKVDDGRESSGNGEQGFVLHNGHRQREFYRHPGDGPSAGFENRRDLSPCHAACIIQKHWRGYHTREKIMPAIEHRRARKRASPSNPEDKAATLIQRQWRKWVLDNTTNERLQMYCANKAADRTETSWQGNNKAGVIQDQQYYYYNGTNGNRRGCKQEHEVDITNLVRDGLKSQLHENKEREQGILSRWAGLVRNGALQPVKGHSAPSSIPVSPPKEESHVNGGPVCKQSKRPTMAEIESWWKAVPGTEVGIGAKTSGDGIAYITDPNQGPYHFRNILRKGSNPAILPPKEAPFQPSIEIKFIQSGLSNGNKEDSNDTGPYDFRKLLRKTDHAPTETLRRCKGLAPLSANGNNTLDPFARLQITSTTIDL